MLAYSYYRKPCRVKYKFTESGEKVRISRRTGSVIPKSPELRERRDFKSRSGYVGKRGTHNSQHTPTVRVQQVSMMHARFQRSMVSSFRGLI